MAATMWSCSSAVRSFAGRYAVPLRETSPAAGGGGVLGDERRVPTEGCLPPVIGGLRWREPLGNEVTGVGQDGFPASGPHVVPLARPQSEAPPESRRGQPGEDDVEIPHRPISLGW